MAFIEAERRQLRAHGPHFRIVRRVAGQATPNSSHGEAVAVHLVHSGQLFQVGLGTVLVRLFAYLARHSQVAQTARQIERGTRVDRLMGSPPGGKSASGIPRRNVRVYVGRIRVAIALALKTAGLEIMPASVLASDVTAQNEVAYRIRGTFEWFCIEE